MVFCLQQIDARQVRVTLHCSAWQPGKKNVDGVGHRCHLLRTPWPAQPRGLQPVDNVCCPGVSPRSALFYISLLNSLIDCDTEVSRSTPDRSPLRKSSNTLPPRSRTYLLNASISLARLR